MQTGGARSLAWMAWLTAAAVLPRCAIRVDGSVPPVQDAGVDAPVDTGVDVPPVTDMGAEVSAVTDAGVDAHAFMDTAADVLSIPDTGVDASVVTDAGVDAGTPRCPSGMVLIPEGTFTMGSRNPVLCFDSCPTPHTVTLSRPYCLDVTEVTVAAYRNCPTSVCTAPSTSPGSGPYGCNWMVSGRDNHPINCVDWNQARAYCQWVGGGGGDLPTEAQWEFAASNGGMWQYPWGNDAPRDQLCWSGGSAVMRSGTCPVMSDPVGAFGLYDMAGNVYEWVLDGYGPYPSGPVTDPTGAPDGSYRVVRGGGWGDVLPVAVLASLRFWFGPVSRNGELGFRCVRGPSGSP